MQPSTSKGRTRVVNRPKDVPNIAPVARLENDGRYFQHVQVDNKQIALPRFEDDQSK
jgi:hypothetical protein